MASSAKAQPSRPAARAARHVSLPPQWLAMYEDFITKNAGQVSQIESALRSLTYIIPGRFRDAEIASESIHSGVQLLSLYHDTLLAKAVAKLPLSPSTTATAAAPSAHTRYTRFWTQKSALYRRVAMVLQMVIYTQLLWEMTAKRRGGEKRRWKVVVLLEAIKALCRLLLMRVTRSRPLVSPPLPEREPVPDAEDTEDDTSGRSESELMDEVSLDAAAHDMVGASSSSTLKPHEKEWTMPRTGMSLPSLPTSGDISSYLLGRVLTADDIKPATKLLNRLHGSGQAAEVLHILSPLIYAMAEATAEHAQSSQARSWTPWLVGVGAEYAARQLRRGRNGGSSSLSSPSSAASGSSEGSLRATALEREEWDRRGWAMGWWAMRGAFYDRVTKGVVGGVRRRVPGFVAGVMEDYEYLWENYYFSTSA